MVDAFLSLANLPYRPFIDPLDIGLPALREWSYVLLIPVAFLVSLTYRAVRSHHTERFWRSVFVMTAQIVLAIVGLTIAAQIFVQIVLPILVP
ncbi:MAG: hypothetical protein AAGB51_10380 [Planctomycetota bacterium]